MIGLEGGRESGWGVENESRWKNNVSCVHMQQCIYAATQDHLSPHADVDSHSSMIFGVENC